MVLADDAGRRGGRRPSRRHWRLKVVLLSSALPPSRDHDGLRGTQKPFARRSNAVANTVAPARCLVAGATSSCARKTTSYRRWRLEVVLPSPILSTSRDDGG